MTFSFRISPTWKLKKLSSPLNHSKLLEPMASTQFSLKILEYYGWLSFLLHKEHFQNPKKFPRSLIPPSFALSPKHPNLKPSTSFIPLVCATPFTKRSQKSWSVDSNPTSTISSHPFQASFILDIIIAQEIFHIMSTSKSKKGFMAVKIDLEKAFNKLEWGFIRHTLAFFKFPSKWINPLCLAYLPLVSRSSLMVSVSTFFNPLEVLDKETLSLVISASSIWNT